jgi:hypothetical protein
MLSYLKFLLTCFVALGTTSLHAEVLAGQYSSMPYPSVADNIAAMDKDHDGIVTVHELREFIESKRGKGYEQKLFDEMEKSAENRSCGSSFSKSLY